MAGAIGPTRRMRTRPSMGIAAVSGAPVGDACGGDRQNSPSDRLPTSMRPAGCAARTCGGHDNILKRLLVHVGGFNFLRLAMRQCLGLGTPRRLQGRAAGALAVFIAVRARLDALWRNHEPSFVDRSPWSSPRHRFELLPVDA